MTQADVPQESSGGSAPQGETDRRGTYLPGKLFWILFVLSILVVLVARVTNEDRSVSHIAIYITAMICGGALWMWFAFRSAYSRALRAIVTIAVIGLFAYLGSQYRIVRFTGDMIPEFGRRLPPVDSRMEKLKTSGTADLVSTTADDFPQFLGPRRDGVLRDVRLSPDWQQHPPVQRWRRPIGAGWASFAVVNGFAVTLEQRGGEELTTCYRVEDGEPIWSSGVETRHTSPLGFIGPRSTPTIYDGKVYSFGATAIMRCLRGTDGQVVWERDLYKELGISQADAEKYISWGRSNSPLVAGDNIVVPVGGADKPITLMALNPETGATVWQKGTYQASYASPVLATLLSVPQILSVNQDYVTSHDVETGEILWQQDWPGLSYMNANCSQPIAVDDHRVFLSKGYGTGAELLSLSHDPDWSVTSLWKAKVMKTKFSNVLIHEGYVYGLDDGILSCIELDTGKRKWKKGRYGYGQNLLVDNLIIVLAENGDLALVEANPQQFIELARVPALEGHTWNNPVLYGDLLLMRNSEEAVCYELTLQ